ncbi:MAG: hypothetical protein ABIJ09_18375 [Pseudomonadota bacterium]
MREMLALLVLVLGAACPAPYYDDDIGVPGVATDEGVLAGRFAHRQRYIYVTYVPILSQEVESGGDQYLLVRRDWDAEQSRYREQWTFCIDINHEAAGLVTETLDAARDSVVFSETLAEVEHATGQFTVRDGLQMWALRNMPDPLNTPIPTPDNYKESPQKDWIYDADGDGHLGCTSRIHGILEGEDYFVNRKVSGYRGVTTGPDRVLGLMNQRSSWSVLESTVALAVHTGDIPSDQAKQHPDPKRSWFEQVRLPDDATCTEVRAAKDDGTLSTTRPF